MVFELKGKVYDTRNIKRDIRRKAGKTNKINLKLQQTELHHLNSCLVAQKSEIKLTRTNSLTTSQFSDILDSVLNTAFETGDPDFHAELERCVCELLDQLQG